MQGAFPDQRLPVRDNGDKPFQGFFDGFAEIGEFRLLLGTCLSKSIDIYAKV